VLPLVRLVKLATLACAAFPALAGGACLTEDLHQDVFTVTDPSNDGRFGFYLIRDDVYQYVPSQTSYPYRCTIDGKAATWNTSTYATFLPNIYQHFPVPSGSHAITIIDDASHVSTATLTIEARPDGPPPDSDPGHFANYMAVVFFGGASGMNTRVLISDPATVPAGMTHVRVMNAFSDHLPLQVVECPASFAWDQTYTAGDCAPIGAPIEYGAMYETDATPDVVTRLGYYWTGLGGGAAAVAPIDHLDAAGGFITRIPTDVWGPSDRCPSCILKEL
jgi:hypothetical protein